MRGCTCHGLVLCAWCAQLAARAGVLAPPEAPALSEKAFQAAIVRLAKQHGWYVFHPTIAKKSVPGYPDLTCVHPDKHLALWAELKVDTAQPTLQQWHWLRALEQVTETAAYL